MVWQCLFGLSLEEEIQRGKQEDVRRGAGRGGGGMRY